MMGEDNAFISLMSFDEVGQREVNTDLAFASTEGYLMWVTGESYKADSMPSVRFFGHLNYYGC
jgi:hypothetical protein